MSIIYRKTLPSAGYKMLSEFLMLIIIVLKGLNPSELSCYAWHSTKSKQLWFRRELDVIISKLFLISTKKGNYPVSNGQNIAV